jgi:hypothetical protein
MNTQLITASYNEAIQVDFTQDAWFNATAVAAQFDKRPNDWLALESTKEYMSALSEISKYQESWYLKTKRGKHGGGTWMHPKLAIPFARWLDVRFAVWCDLQIELILKGTAQPSPTPLPKSRKALPAVNGRGLQAREATVALHRSTSDEMPRLGNYSCGAMSLTTKKILIPVCFVFISHAIHGIL